MKKVETSNKLIDAAEKELIANDGVLEMSAVAKLAGVSIGLAYHHFGSKTGLIAAVVDRFYVPIRNIALGDKISLSLDWHEREKMRTAALIDYYYANSLSPLIVGRLAREPEVQDIEKSHMDALLELGARNLSQGQKEGVVNPDLSPSIMVAMLMGGLSMTIEQALLAPERPDATELLNQLWLFVEKAILVP